MRSRGQSRNNSLSRQVYTPLDVIEERRESRERNVQSKTRNHIRHVYSSERVNTIDHDEDQPNPRTYSCTENYLRQQDSNFEQVWNNKSYFNKKT